MPNRSNLPGEGDRAQLGNELELLADRRRAAHDQTWTGAANDPWSPEVIDAQDALKDRIVAAGYTVEHAEQAVTTWIIMGGAWTVLESLDRTDEEGPLPDPA